MSDARRFPKTAATVLLVALGVALPYLVPRAERLRLLSRADLARALGAFAGRPRAPLVRRNEALPLRAVPAPAPPSRAGSEPARSVPPRPAVAELPAPAVPIEDPSHELDRFFERLSRLGEEGTDPLVRITHFGDSPLTGDLVSGEARELLQQELGDGGPGFVLPAKPWAWYGHQGIRIDAAGWTARSHLLPGGGGGFDGLGLVSFASGSPGARSEIRRERGTFVRAEVTFTAEPGAGTLLVALDDQAPREVSTSAAVRATGRFAAEATGGASRVTLLPKGDGVVTLHGVVLESAGPGLVWDAIGANGASVHAVNRLDEEGFVEALALRRSDLVILNYGTNESTMEGVGGPRYEREYAVTIGRVRKALPGASILVMSPMDRGARLPDGSIGTLPAIQRLVAVQRKVARENRCAFFDTFDAMGGEGTMGRWYEHAPRLVTGDFTHTTKPGSDRVARLLVGALRAARAAWARASARPEPAAGPASPSPSTAAPAATSPVSPGPGGGSPPS